MYGSRFLNALNSRGSGPRATRYSRRMPAFFAMTLLVAVAPGCRCFQYDKEGAVSPEVAQCRHYSHLSMAALDRGDADQAERLGAQAVQSCPHDVQARRALADAMWRRGKTTTAIEQIDQARKLSPDDPTLLVQQGEMYLSLDQWEAARAVAAWLCGPEAAAVFERLGFVVPDPESQDSPSRR